MDYREHHYPSACRRLTLFARDYAGPGAGSSGQPPPALLLMHGLTRNSADFEPLAAHLAGRYRLIVPDQRGRGRSPDDPDPAHYRPDIYARDMLALLDDLGIASAGLIGTSMGGMMAMILGATAPARVPAIVLNDIGPVLDPAGLARIAGYVGGGAAFAHWDEAAHACAAINQAAFPDFGPADWLAFARRTGREQPDGSIAFAYDPAIARGFDPVDPADQQAGEVAPADLWPLWDALAAIPVLVVRGALSDLLAPATVSEMQHRHSGPFTSVEIPGRGHAPLLDEPAALGAITPFLERYLPA